MSALSIKPSHRGRLRSMLGLPVDSPIPATKLAQAKRSPSPAVRKMATFAQNSKSWTHK